MRRWRFVRLTLLAALAALLAGAAPPRQAAAQEARCFAETGFRISGPFLDYWERNGDLPVFGYPISQQQTETVEGLVVQAQQMLWVGRGDGGPGLIFVINGRSLQGPAWELYVDSYVEGEPVGTDELPPPGKFAPVRGFGKLWRANPQLRELLDWATAPEQADAGVSARFSGPQGLSWLVGRQGLQSVYILRAGQPAVALEVGWQR